MEVHFHPDTSGCYGGHIGSELGGRVDVCVVLVSEIARETVLHEMGHAWIDQNVPQSVRDMFMELRGLHTWNGTGVPWDGKAYEHGAETIAWALGNRFLSPTIPNLEPWRLAAAFELLTLCENLNAQRALALGMINRVVDRDDLLKEALRISEQLAGFNHDALWMTKRTIQRAASMSPAEALEMAGDASLVMRLHARGGGRQPD